MKLKYIFASIVATLALAVSCQKEADHYLDEIKVSSSYVSLSTGLGASTSITVTATDNWSIALTGKKNEWLHISPTTGGPGETVVTFSASAGEGRTEEVIITCAGKTQRINVIQGLATVSNATCADVIAGPDSKTYRVTGVVTSIANTTYGNWYLNDGTGEVYIYGTLDAKGNEKNFSSLGIEVGDELTVEGPKTTYNGTVELVNVTVVKINKSLIKVEEVDPEDATLGKEGGEVTVTLSNKGETLKVVIPEEAKEWLGISEVNGEYVTFKAAPNNTPVVREATVVFSTTQGNKVYSAELTIAQKGAVVSATVAEFLAAKEDDTVYRLQGIITALYTSDKQGKSFYIQDYSGNVLVYRAEGFDTAGAKVGDIVTVTGKRTSYKETPQMGTTTFESLDKVVATKTVAELRALEDDKNTYFMVTGKVVKSEEPNTKFDLETYGNLSLQDESGEIYVYGVSTGWNGATKQFGTLGVKEGDILTVIGYRTSYTKGDYTLLQIGGAMYVSHVPADAE